MEWSDGYVVETPYAAEFFAAQGPGRLSACCILNGVEPVDASAPFTWCELGSGHGLTAAVLAAGHPHGRFYAADFMPSHVASTRALADEAGLDNLTVLENSFAELAEGAVDLPAFDYVTLHGVYSWVSPENRAHIVRFLGRYLKPGGLVFVSYNALPGWSVAAPLQRLVMDHARAHPDGPVAQIGNARAFVDRVAEAGAAYFTANETPILQDRLQVLRSAHPTYLAHEYLNRCWQPQYHADVARHFAEAKLEFVGPAEPWKGMLAACLPAAGRQLLDGIGDPVFRETVQDFLMNTSFRSDVFVRGARRMAPKRRQAAYARLAVTLTVPRGMATLQPVAATDDPELATQQRRLLDRLADGPCRLVDLAAWTGDSERTVLQAVALLVAHDQATLYLEGPVHPDATAGTLRLNRAIAGLSHDEDRYHAFASPVTGSGVKLDRVQQLVWSALQQSPAGTDAQRLARQVQAALTGPGAAAATEATLAALTERVGLIQKHRVPVWRRLGLL